MKKMIVLLVTTIVVSASPAFAKDKKAPSRDIAQATADPLSYYDECLNYLRNCPENAAQVEVMNKHLMDAYKNLFGKSDFASRDKSEMILLKIGRVAIWQYEGKLPR